MGIIKEAVFSWAVALSSAFGTAAASPSAAPDKQPSENTTEMPADLASTTAEKRIALNEKAQTALEAAGKNMAYQLTLHYEFSLANQVTKMGDALYYKLPVPVWNKVATALNNDTKRAKIIKSITAVVYGVLSKDTDISAKCRAAILSWEKDPLKLAKFMGKSIGEDFVQAPKEKTTAPAHK